MKNITAKTFLTTLFPPDLLLPDELPVVAHPDSFVDRSTDKTVEYYRQFHPRGVIPEGELATYFCVSTVQRQRRRQVKKRLEDVRTAMVLVCDDWGTKSQRPYVLPSYELQTSIGNYQGGYLLEPFDVSSAAGRAFYDSVLVSLATAGYNDPGFRSASRLARLPGSLHRTGHVADITLWEPSRVWDLEDLAEAFDICLTDPRPSRPYDPGLYSVLSDIDNDPVYDWLVASRLVLGANDQWIYITCPWRDQHTDGAQGSSSTAYSPRDYGRSGVGFKCLHGHCAHRTTVDFLEWAMRQRNTDALIQNNNKGAHHA